MRKSFYLIFFLFINICFTLKAQKSEYIFSGIIKNAQTDELLNGATIQITEINKTTITDKNGYFRITLERGIYTYKIVFIGFEEYSSKVKLTANTKVIVQLKEKTILVKEVEITSEQDDKNVRNVKVGEIEMKAEEIKKMPSLMGETDILKSIQLIPGVQSSDDGGTTLFIRGSNSGQNLMMYDNAVIYNPSHLMGFFSIFNNDAIDKVKLIKSGIPSYYGGRLASVVEITGRNGNMQKPSMSGGIGVISSRLTLESPINKGKGSVIISGRRTYLDLISNTSKNLIKTQNSNVSDFFKTTKYYFYDINLKAIYNFTKRDILSLSSYIGNDIYKYSYNNSDFTKMIWGNKLVSLKWTHSFNTEMYFDQTVYITDYTFDFKTLQNRYSFRLNSGARDWSYKINLNINKYEGHKLRVGLEYISHNFSPTNINANALDIKLNFAKMTNLYSNEYGVYVNDEIEISNKLSINAGLRYSLFQQIGPFIDYKNANTGQISDTINYSRNELIKTYSRPEPRLSLCYLLNKNSSIKASLTQNNQYIHLVSIPSVSMPSDIWIPSMKNIKPEFGTQYTFGYFRNFKENTYESYIDLYYKHIDNLIEFEKGVINSAFEQSLFSDIVSGNGEMMGIEFYLKKNKGKLNGSISYTLSKSVEQFDKLNEGKSFNSSQDRRHDMSILLNYELNKRWSFSAVFVYISGKPVTMPDKLFVIDENIISEYGDKNAFKLADYYRMDVSVIYNIVIDKKWESYLNFSIYNVLNRANPFYVYFETEGSIDKYNFDIKAKQVSLFPILPSITWNFKF